jgi:hypothetical protein
MEKGPGHHDYSDNRPANFTSPLNITEGRHAGQGGIGADHNNHDNNYGSRHGKIVLTLLPPFYQKYEFPKHTNPHDSNGWTQTF